MTNRQTSYLTKKHIPYLECEQKIVRQPGINGTAPFG